MTDRKKCENKMCTCMVSGDSDYCSPSCANTEDSDIVKIECECGHSGCGGDITQ